MGAYSPLPWAPESLVDDVVRTVVQPTVDEMHRRGTPFAGLLYIGLALTSRGLRVVEFNARFGDPETQVVLARLLTPLGGVLRAAAIGHLADLPDLRWTPDAAVTVVVAAENYPDTPRTGDPIEGLDAANAVPDAYVLHAGTRLATDRRRERRWPGALGRRDRDRPGRRAGGCLRGGRPDLAGRLAPPAATSPSERRRRRMH